jgi:uncharacterized protein
MENNYQVWIDHLGLTAHPEGGYFKEVYRNKNEISDKELTTKYSGNRNLATSIYFMLKSGQVSMLHRLKSDEIWYFHYGSPVLVHIFSETDYKKYFLGNEFKSGQVQQLIIPAGSVFGAEVKDKDSFSIFSCMVTPGFHFDDFELISRQEMIKKFPEIEQIINRITIK